MTARTARTIRMSVLAIATSLAAPALAAPPHPSTFSIAACDPEAGECGVAVASRFFAVGSVVPHARAGAGAVATQSFANTTFGPRGLDLLGAGLAPEEALKVMLRADAEREKRQVGIVSAAGESATFTGSECNAWAGGRRGSGYAVQGNILTGEDVVAATERAFLASKGKPLAERLFEALKAGDAAGGDSRGRQSAALLVVREKGGYGGFSDRAIDIRVDDHGDPFGELHRLLGVALVNDSWNRGWTAFTEKQYAEARKWQERTAERAEKQPGILPEVLYDLGVIRLAAGDPDAALAAVQRAVTLNPKLSAQAKKDKDLEALWPKIELK